MPSVNGAQITEDAERYRGIPYLCVGASLQAEQERPRNSVSVLRTDEIKSGAGPVKDVYRDVQNLRKAIDELNERFSQIEEYIESQPEYSSQR